MTNKWSEMTLGKVCKDISYGYTASASTEEIGPKFLRITDIVPDRINWENVPYCIAENNSIEKYRLEKGDIVIARTGATTGYNKIIKEINFDAIYASYLIRYKIDENVASPEFIGHVLQSTNWYDYIDAIAGGSAQPGANARELASFEFLLPSIREQKAIASILSSLDDKIDLLHRQNKTLEAMAETLFRQWFIEVNGLHNNICTISDLIVFNPKRELAKGVLAPYLEMANVSTNSFNPMNWYNREFSSGMRFINGDTLLARITPCLENGKASYVTFLEERQVGWGSTEFIVLNTKPELHSFFSYILCRNKDFKEYAESCLEGSSGRQRVNVNHLEKFELNKPTTEIVNSFNALANSIVPKLINNAKQIQILEKLRDTLLPKLMSGEVRVKI